MKILKKAFLTLCSFMMMLSIFSADLMAKEDDLYYLSFDYAEADKYVSETIGEFINLESAYLGRNLMMHELVRVYI